MRLSKRIYKIVDMIALGESVADIGTDHGYVPMVLVREGKCPRVIMSDISEASLSKAKKTFSDCNISISESDFRIGDGLETIVCGEVDAVIIGGLGGYTIVDILNADLEKSLSFGKMVLQPRKHSGVLRHYLYTHGWDVISECLAPEGKFECEIIVAVPGENKQRNELYPADDIRWKYPPKLIEKDRELAVRRVNWKISSIEEQIRNLDKSSERRDALIEKLNADKEYLKNLIKS